ncbi:MAG: hypothetical protein ACNA8P_08035 [Phycisphaerales bacterium]
MMRALLVCGVFLFLSSIAFAQPYPGGDWINDIPEPQQAIQKITGDTELEMKSRQGAALYAIQQVILKLSGNEFRNPRRLTTREEALLTQYSEYYQTFSREYAERLNRGLTPEQITELGPNRPSAPFANMEMSLRSNPGFQRMAFTAIMGEPWVTQWFEPLVARERAISDEVRSDFDAFNEQQRQKMIAQNEKDKAEARVARQQFILGNSLILLGLVWTVLSWRRVRLDPDDPLRFTGRRRNWTLQPRTGFASDVKVYTTQQRTTTVERFNDFRPDRRTTTVTDTHHCEFMLNTESGTVPIHLTNAGLQVGEGQLLSCVWPRKGEKYRGLIMVQNHDTNQHVIIRTVSGWMVGPRFIPGIVTVVGFALFPGFAFALLYAIAFFILWSVMMALRTRTFRRKDAPRVLELLRTRAAEASAVVGVS